MTYLIIKHAESRDTSALFASVESERGSEFWKRIALLFRGEKLVSFSKYLNRPDVRKSNEGKKQICLLV